MRLSRNQRPDSPAQATKFGEVCQAACSRREQETKLLTTALGEANRRFEVLGCRRIQPADYEEPAGVRSHLVCAPALRAQFGARLLSSF